MSSGSWMSMLVLLSAVTAMSQGMITEQCINCLAKVEEGVSGVCETVRGVEYCGVYKITKLYWIDCHMPTIRGVQHTGPDVNKSYRDCTFDEKCARGCIKAYMDRYGFLCRQDLGGKAKLSCEDYGRMHNGGGPSGCAMRHTLTHYVQQLMRPRCQTELGLTTPLAVAKSATTVAPAPPAATATASTTAAPAQQPAASAVPAQQASEVATAPAPQPADATAAPVPLPAEPAGPQPAENPATPAQQPAETTTTPAAQPAVATAAPTQPPAETTAAPTQPPVETTAAPTQLPTTQTTQPQPTQSATSNLVSQLINAFSGNNTDVAPLQDLLTSNSTMNLLQDLVTDNSTSISGTVETTTATLLLP